jgi:hypothetical protein
MVEPGPDESCRWECIDRRWVSLSLGKGADAGKVIVLDSNGQRAVAENHDAAIALAKTWRT